jgi:hypothetical protein
MHLGAMPLISALRLLVLGSGVSQAQLGFSEFVSIVIAAGSPHGSPSSMAESSSLPHSIRGRSRSLSC